jgi:hypothetical protein
MLGVYLVADTFSPFQKSAGVAVGFEQGLAAPAEAILIPACKSFPLTQ